MLSLEEAIKHCDEVAEQNDKESKLWAGGVTEAFKQKEQKLCECASEHRQLAEWLRELKRLKDFANFVAESVFEEDFEENGRFYAEAFCRKLNKLGVIRSENNKWVYDGEVNADGDT